jgi:hypothetical protein
MRFAAAYTGGATPLAQGTNSTSLQSLDSTALGSSFVRETTAGQGSRSVGFATGTTDDYAAVFVAVREAIQNAQATTADSLSSTSEAVTRAFTGARGSSDTLSTTSEAPVRVAAYSRREWRTGD